MTKTYTLTVHPFLSTLALSKKVKVISTDSGASLPAKDGQAELMNSSLVNYSEVTLCARFLTHHFSTHLDGSTTQTLISYWTHDLLSSFIARPCDNDNPPYFQEHSNSAPLCHKDAAKLVCSILLNEKAKSKW